MDPYICIYPLIITVILVIITNVLMVVHIFKANNSSLGAGFTFKLIGISNVACGIFTCIHGLVTRLAATTFPVWINSFCTITSFLLQLGFNVSLAFQRLQVIRNPVRYHSKEAKKSLEKKLCLIVFVVSLILGASCTALRFLFDNILIMTILLAASRAIGYFIMCILYCKLYFAMKSHNQVMAERSGEQGEASTSNSEVIRKRREQLEHSKKFFIGITSSFFVLNLPTMGTFVTTDEYPTCSTIQGALSIASLGFSFINMIFDSAWYYYMHRRSTRAGT